MGLAVSLVIRQTSHTSERREILGRFCGGGTALSFHCCRSLHAQSHLSLPGWYSVFMLIWEYKGLVATQCKLRSSSRFLTGKPYLKTFVIRSVIKASIKPSLPGKKID